MEAPKPDEEIPAWKYLDIFMFSNGQENSPPRKYHLVSDHLEFWSDTLKQLAQEQYGFTNNISLYTTQGRLIKTPMELRHNNAYVAVKIPGEFIDAGYDRYLIKATRSWEKRQDKRFSNTAEKPDEQQMMGNSDPESIAAIPSITLKTIVPSIVDNQGRVIVYPKERNTSSSKQLDISERTFIQRSLSKKIETALSPVKSIKTPAPKRDINMHNDETTDQSKPQLKHPFKGKVQKAFQKRRNSEAVLSKVEEVVNQLENSSPRNVEINAKTKRNEKRPRVSLTKTVENEKDLQNKPKIIPHLFGNRPRILMTKPVENEKDQRAKLRPFSNSIENRNRTAINSGENTKNEQNKPKIIAQLNENQFDNKLDTKVVIPNVARQHLTHKNNHNLGDSVGIIENDNNDGMPINISNNKYTKDQQNYTNKSVAPVLSFEIIQKPVDKSEAGSSINKNNDDPLKNKDALSPPATSDRGNNISNLSKGIINMRIEVWNSSDVTRNASCEIKAPVIIVTNEIGSQVDMTNQVGHNKELNQVIASGKDGVEGNFKVILVRSSYPNNNISESSKFTVIGECVMVLPVTKLDELLCRCSGGESKNINCLGTNLSDYNPVKPSASCTSIHKENVNRICSLTDIHNGIRPDSAGLNVNDETIQDKTEYPTVQQKSVSINPSEQKDCINEKQFESTNFENLPTKPVESAKSSEGEIIYNRNFESTNLPLLTLLKPEVSTKYTLDSKIEERERESSVSQPDNREPVGSEEMKSKQIKMHSTHLEETDSSKVIKNDTKTDESVDISHCKTEKLNIKTPEYSLTHGKSDELFKCPSAESLVPNRTVIKESKNIKTLRSHSENVTKASAAAEATSLLETRGQPAKTQALTQDKASQTEWTNILWEAKLQEDGHYSFHLPTLSRLKEYNL